MKPLIWWLSQAEMEIIGNELPFIFPKYLRDQYRSSWGRAGRGRLWINEQFGAIEFPWPETAITQWLEQCSGVVIHFDDRKFLKDLPGLLTDLKMQRFGS